MHLPPMTAFRTASELFKLDLTISNVFGTAISPCAFTGGVILTLLATICVAPRKYGDKLPDFVITFMIAN